jgi:tetratricopeptide (TPR) repeat protein
MFIGVAIAGVRSFFKRKRNLWILLGCVILAVLIFNPISRIFFGFLIGAHQVKNEEVKLQKPEIYKPVAMTLATYCQSDQRLFPKILSYAWLPKEVSHFGKPWCQVSSNSADVEFGGGFYHFGYSLQFDAADSVPATNAWNLFLVREEQPDKFLITLKFPSAEHASAADLENLLCGSFDEMIQNNQPDGYIGKVKTQLRFGQTAKAAGTCEAWVKARPDSWCSQFTYAHVRCRLGETETAAVQFKDWVKAHQTFGNDIYLALFNYREGRTNQAVEAVRMALSQPLVESPNEGANVFYLAYNGAMIAYDAGDLDLSISLCDKMLPFNNYDANAFKRNALRIKAAAMFMKGRQSAALDLMKQAESDNEPDPFSHEPRAKADQTLQNAIQKNDFQFVGNVRNLADEMQTWYSPFETDESGWHGGDLNIPTPFPSSWKTDQMNTNFSE